LRKRAFASSADAFAGVTVNMTAHFFHACVGTRPSRAEAHLDYVFLAAQRATTCAVCAFKVHVDHSFCRRTNRTRSSMSRPDGTSLFADGRSSIEMAPCRFVSTLRTFATGVQRVAISSEGAATSSCPSCRECGSTLWSFYHHVTGMRWCSGLVSDGSRVAFGSTTLQTC